MPNAKVVKVDLAWDPEIKTYKPLAAGFIKALEDKA